MVEIYFRKQFVEAIESGVKKQTIRQKTKCKVGTLLQLCAAKGTKHYRKILDAKCVSVRRIEIDLKNGKFLLGTIWMDAKEKRQLAIDDGFPGLRQFYEFFRKHYGDSFKGYLIKWEKIENNKLFQGDEAAFEEAYNENLMYWKDVPLTLEFFKSSLYNFVSYYESCKKRPVITATELKKAQEESLKKAGNDYDEYIALLRKKYGELNIETIKDVILYGKAIIKRWEKN
jgi:hypothetical protein